jgi:hypothetical protein
MKSEDWERVKPEENLHKLGWWQTTRGRNCANSEDISKYA